MSSKNKRFNDESYIRNTYRRWKRWSIHLFIVIFLNILVWGCAFLFYPQIDMLYGIFRFRALFGGFMLISSIPLAAHYVHVRIANAEDKAVVNARREEQSTFANDYRNQSHRLELVDDETFHPDYDEKKKRSHHSH